MCVIRKSKMRNFEECFRHAISKSKNGKHDFSSQWLMYKGGYALVLLAGSLISSLGACGYSMVSGWFTRGFDALLLVLDWRSDVIFYI